MPQEHKITALIVRNLIYLLAFVPWLVVVHAQSNGADMDMDKDKAMVMLKKYNYMGEGNPDPVMHNDSMYTEALMMFQMVAGLNQTGELDTPTVEKMRAKRCGIPDFMGKDDMMKRRRRRYVVYGSKWSGGQVSYSYKGSYPSRGGLSTRAVQGQIERAFDAWAQVAKLSFSKTSREGDIRISFVSGRHDDDYPLDGPGGTLAHAFFPVESDLGGDMHFDDAETWAVEGEEGTDLYYVALHELGHSLGLQHSMEMDAIMYPYYPGYIPDLKLTADDIAGMRAIYGPPDKRRTAPPTPRPTDVTPTLRDQFCRTGSLEAIGTLNGRLFAFQGELYAELDNRGIRPGYPRYIRDDWPQFPVNPDAALAWENHGILLVFKDDQYWRYYMDDSQRPMLTTGYPRPITRDFKAGLPNKVDSAFVWSKNGRTYIVSGGKYYRIRNGFKVYETHISAKCDRWYYSYPKDFADVWGIERSVSDAAMYHDRTFFFSDTQYYRYNDRKYKPDTGYPKSVAESWFGCRPHGALEQEPEMEMELMERESQFEEITSRFVSDTAPGRISPGAHVMVVVIAASLLQSLTI